MRGFTAVLAGAFFACGLASPSLAAAPPLTVPIASCAAQNSKVTGVVGDAANGSMRQFLGIPYAQPPLAARRWMPPETICWNGTRDALTFGSQCVQPSGFGDENCLFLNIFTQSTGKLNKQPVMVYIHGGGLNSGSGSFGTNPANFVAKGVVVVTINYRIGALGFLAHPALDNAKKKNTGNYGILDQQAALTWVKKNIAKFGGDPANVTIFGQSAGGLSVLVQLVSPLSTGLFNKAILESPASYFQPMLLGEAETLGTTFGNALGCSSGTNAQKATCLRGKPAANIVATQNTLGQSTRLLRVDGVVLKASLHSLLSTGDFKKVPIVVGSTHDESRFHINGNPTLGTGGTCAFVSSLVPSNYQTALSQNNVSAAIIPQVMAKYPPGSTPMSANLAFAAQATDASFACRALRVNRWLAQNNAVNYGYEFNDPKSPAVLWPEFKLSDNSTFPYGAYHGSEGPFLFRAGTTNACGGPIPALTASQKKLSAVMVTYWTTFAKTGNPNPAGGGVPAWPEFTTTVDSKMMSFQGSTPKLLATKTFDNNHKCSSFWNGVSP